MPVMTAGDIGAKRIGIEQEIIRLNVEIENKKAELKELQKNCPHPYDLTRDIVRTWRNFVEPCAHCGSREYS